MSSTYIILVNYNNHKDTLKCLKSISCAGYEKFVIVVDNNSFVPGLNEIKKKYPNIVLIKNRKNVGFGAANNIGINWVLNNTVCEYIFILNNDTTINKSTLSILENSFSYSDNIAITVPKIVMMHNPCVLWYGGGGVDWKKGSARVPGFGENSDAIFAIKKKYVYFASGCAMLIKSEIISSLGGFDERYFMYEEDLELSIRIINANYKILYSPSALVFHKGQGSIRASKTDFQKKLSPRNPHLSFYAFHTFRNRLLTMRIHARGYNLFKFHIFFWPGLLFKILVYLKFRRWDGISGCFKGIISAWNVNITISDIKNNIL